jgi:hypothetical protein
MGKLWGEGPSVSDQRRTDPVHPPKPPGKKDKARWCRGKRGVEHVWRVTVPTNVDGFFAFRDCYLVSYRTGLRQWSHWACKHRVVCTSCGKVKRRATRTECTSGVLDPT